MVPINDIFVERKSLIITSKKAEGEAFFSPLCERDYLTENDVKNFIRSILLAVDVLHKNKIIHGMLRPEFIFTKEDLSVCLSEYGLWKYLGNDYVNDSTICSKMYFAPEIIQNIGIGPGVDLWCVGVITYILLSGMPPFYGKSVESLTEGIIKADFDYPPEAWEDVSDAAIDFIDSLLIANPKQRMTVSQALNHDFMKNETHTILNNVPEQLSNMMNLYKSRQMATSGGA